MLFCLVFTILNQWTPKLWACKLKFFNAIEHFFNGIVICIDTYIIFKTFKREKKKLYKNQNINPIISNSKLKILSSHTNSILIHIS